MNSAIKFIERLLRATLDALGLNRQAFFVKGKRLRHISAEDANAEIARRIREPKPCVFGRLGTPEANACLNYYEIGLSHSHSAAVRFFSRILGLRQKWDPNLRQMLETNVGVFPTDEKTVEKFVRLYRGELNRVEALAYWGWVPGESLIINHHCPGALLYDPRALEPYLFENPWSASLAGKRVLVIHPFRDSILTQYEKRRKLFANPDILPDFDLRVIKAVQSLAGTPTPFASWFAALEWMKTQMELAPFDVCLIGAGSYGLPLCVHAKRLGASGIQIGGGLQILFGIAGKRWESMPHISRFFNPNWTRPLPEERIPSGNKIEGGCYW